MDNVRRRRETTNTSEPGEVPLIANDMAIEIVDLSALRDPARAVKPVSKRITAGAKAILEQWGQRIPIAVDETGVVIAGLEFLAAARELGWKTIKVVRVSNLSSEHIRVLTIALARLPDLSSWDNDALRLEFSELLSIDLGFDLHDVSGFTIGEMDVVLEGDDAGDKPDPLDEIPEATVASSAVSIRVTCGSSGTIACCAEMPSKPTTMPGSSRERRRGSAYQTHPSIFLLRITSQGLERSSTRILPWQSAK